MQESLNPFDLITIAVIVVSTFWGGVRGIITQLASILSWVLSWYVATHYYSFVAQFISENSEWRTPAATVVTFIITALAIRIASNFIKNALSLAGLREFDRQMGALLGAFKGLLFCLLVTFFAVIASEKARDVVQSSKSGPFFVKIILKINERVPESELTKRFASYANVIEENDEIEESEESIEAQVGALVQNLVNGGFLSSSASEIVEEAEANVETKSKQEKGKQESTGQDPASNAFRSFLSSVTNFKNNARSLFSPEAASDSVAEPSPAESAAPPAASASDYSARNGADYPSSRAFYPNDSYYVDSEYSAPSGNASAYQTPAYEYEYEPTATSNAIPNATSDARTRSESRGSGLRERASSDISDFLDAIGGGFRFGSAPADAASSDDYSATRNTGQYAPQSSYDPSYDGYDAERYSHRSERERSARSYGSRASRSRLNSRSYEISQP